MKLFSKISVRLSAFILLFSFLGIYMINIGCTIGNITHELEWFSQSTENHHHGEHNDGHHHSHSSDNNKESENKDDGCCNDVTTTFFASVQSPIQQTLDKLSSTEFVILNVVVNDILNPKFSLGFFIDKRPPPDILPGIPDIRIHIQSFQI